MDVSEVCPTVDAIRAFLEYLVDPLLQEEHFIHDDLPHSQLENVAKQVHSIVLLNNYYHKKLNQELACLPYREFCKIIVDLRPAMLACMKFTLQPDYTDLVNMEQQLSFIEKTIMNSYDICSILDASKKVPNIEDWPISKVAVLLVDRKKENCFLRFSYVTNGVWSLIEKNIDNISQVMSSDVTSEIKPPYKRRRFINKHSKVGLTEDQLLQIGYSAVTEAAGVNSIDMMLLESCNVYSQSKERTASRFYIMKCSRSIVEGFTKVPIIDLIESFWGPLVKRSSSSWKATQVVKYFHMLPYSKIISEWISREIISNCLQDLKFTEKQLSKLEMTESHVENAYSTRDKNGTINMNKNSCDTPKERPKRLIKRPSRFLT